MKLGECSMVEVDDLPVYLRYHLLLSLRAASRTCGPWVPQYIGVVLLQGATTFRRTNICKPEEDISSYIHV